MAEVKKSGTKLSDSPKKEIDEELSNEIALAVASIVAESRIQKKNEDSSLSIVSPKESTAKITTTNNISNLPKSILSKGKLKEKKSLVKIAKSSSLGKKTKSLSPYLDHGKGKKGSSKDVKKENRKEVLKDLGIIRTTNLPKAAGGKMSATTFPSLMDGLFDNTKKAAKNMEKSKDPSGNNVKESDAFKDIDLSKPMPPNPYSRKGKLMDIMAYLSQVQSYINQLGYHRVGEPKIRVDTRLSIKSLMEIARTLIRSAEPIKCLHAITLAIHFTNPLQLVERFPIYFRSKFEGKEYKHVVLGIYLKGRFGALGISRDVGLQDKPITFTKLADLVTEFQRCYMQSGHELVEVKIGGIVTHDAYSLETFVPKIGYIKYENASPQEIEATIERCSKQLRAKMGTDSLRHAGSSASPLNDNGRGRKSSYSLSMPMPKIAKVKSRVNSNLSKTGTVKKSKSKPAVADGTKEVQK